GTLSSRLATARRMLAKRVALPVGALAAAQIQGAVSARVPPTLLVATVKGAGAVAAGAVSANVLALTEGVLKAMLLTKLKTLGAVALVVTVTAAVGWTYRTAEAQAPGPAGSRRPEARVAVDELDELRLEIAALRQGLN